MTTAFEGLNQALLLVEQGRLNAAVSVWRSLPDDFRCRVLQYAIYCRSQSSGPQVDVTLATIYGNFVISKESVTRLLSGLPELLRANAA